MTKNLPLFVLANILCYCSLTAQRSFSEEFPESAIPIAGEKILVAGQPYEIRGICYHPVPAGSSKRSFCELTGDLSLMKEAGINTIRVYEPIQERAVLDEIKTAGLKVIISFGYNQNGRYDILFGTFIDYVKRFKDHEAILLWELGNEYNFHPEWFGGDIDNWYRALNKAAKAIQRIDPGRVVSSAHGELPTTQVLEMCPDIDVWGMNVYRWDQSASILDEWKEISTKPMYFAEVGADSYMAIKNAGYAKGYNEKAQAAAVRTILEGIEKSDTPCAGTVIFAFSDEWWKTEDGTNDIQDVGGKPPPTGVPYDDVANEEFWGLVKMDRTRKEAFEVVKELWGQEPTD